MVVKRTSTEAGFDVSVPGKQRLIHSYHHKLHWKQQVSGEAARICQHDAVIQLQLLRAISLALEAVGFEHADPVALESFRAEVEECAGLLIGASPIQDRADTL
jgi:hypothetical protein